MPTRPMRVCIAGTFDPEFHRNRHLLRLLDLAGIETRVLHVRLWGVREDRVVRRGRLRLAFRAAGALPRVAWRFLRGERPDVLLIAYPGQLDAPLLGPLARWRSVPVVFDPFISLFDTVVEDRGLAGPRSALGRLLAFLDRRACRAADLLLADTPDHAERFSELTGVPRERFRVLPVGADDSLFRPRAVPPEPGSVLFYGTYIPLHGVHTILAAAARLRDRPLRFKLIGAGQERARAEAFVREHRLAHVELAEPVPLERLPDEIARSWLCLGIFGTSGKASRVIPNKIFQCLAVGRPVLTGETPAVTGAFAPDEVATVPPGDPEALAEAIAALADDPARTEALAAAGHARFRRDYRGEVLAGELDRHLREAAGAGRRARGLG